MKIMVAQINPKVGDLKGNTEIHLETIEAAKTQSVDLIVFPELSLLGYPPKDLLLQECFVSESLTFLNKIKDATKGIAIIIGHVVRDEDRNLYNAASLIRDGEVITTIHKTLLPNYNVFDERRYFKPNKKERKIIDFDGVPLGIMICEDLWDYHYNEKVTDILTALGAKLIINISASPFAYGKRYSRFALLREKTFQHKIAMLYVNLVGGQDELIFDGESVAFNPGGSDVATAKKFEEHLFILEFNKNELCFEKVNAPQHYSTIQEIHDALILGTKDYFRKNRFKAAVIGLSGGIDSAVSAALAVKAIGAENVFGVLMPSQFSSDHSINDAVKLSETLGVQHKTIPIQEIVDAYTHTLIPFLGEGNGNFHNDITLQNLQARTRGNILMAFSNDLGCLNISNGNKSENSVGYGTLYGDMAGGLNIIGDVPKTKIYELAEYINSTREMIPFNTIKKAPSAELKPGQVDQDDLPPYPVLDAICKSYLEEWLSVEEIAKNGYDLETVRSIVKRIERNEHKRRQAAFSFVISACDLKMGRRMPITNGFEY